MNLQLANKRALVIGSSRGIGEAIAKALVTEGAVVVVHGRDETKTRRVADEITESRGRAAIVKVNSVDIAGARTRKEPNRRRSGCKSRSTEHGRRLCESVLTWTCISKSGLTFAIRRLVNYERRYRGSLLQETHT
jgi:NAD(P)-dependent dehydrogenase (short-subunit alcohol dehydrogenase family)